jgi:hypothetical protein
MTRKKNCIAAFALLAAGAWLDCAAADAYKVAAKLAYRGEPLGAPTMVVKNGVPASVTVSGSSGYKLDLTVTDIAPDRVKVATAVETRHGAFAPTLVVHPGQPARVRVGDLDLSLVVERSDDKR